MHSDISYNAAIYLRLSKEDGDVTEGGKLFSNSIANQEELVRDYLKSHADIRVHSVYKDDGYSGVNFDRPDFQKMMEDIKSGAVNCVIVKDLSRFGRNYIESGRYIEKIFPMLGVRFIAVTDHYDSMEDNAGSEMIIPFKNLINDAYCRDISIKVRSHLDMKRKNGEYIGAFVAYGYEKDPEDKNRLVIDEYAAGVVRDIFGMKLKGMSQHSIAKKLNSDGILSPLEYMRSRGIPLDTPFRSRAKAKWSHSAVLRILKNEMYTGVLLQGKTGTPNYKIKKRMEKPEDAWVRIEDAFEPIVSDEDFRLVQELLQRDTRIPPKGEKLYPYSGTVFCADCGAPMVRKAVSSGGKRYVYYICSEYKRDKDRCGSHRITEGALDDAVLTAVQEHIGGVLVLEDALRLMENAPEMAADVRKFKERIDLKTQEVEKIKQRKLRLYEDLKDGLLSQDDYEMLREQYTEQISEGEAAVHGFEAEMQKAAENRTEQNEWINVFKENEGSEKLSRHDVVHMIERIEVADAKHINVRFRFNTEYNRLEELIGNVLDEERERKEAI